MTENPFPKWPVYGDSEREGVLRVLESGRWGSTKGEEVSSFERRFAEFHGAEHGIATTSGTTGLSIALRSAGVGPGDEVILPGYTFIASATAILDVLAKPVFVDINLDTLNIDLEGAAQALTARSKAILPVHFGGRLADMDKLKEIAENHDLRIVEDACQAWGSVYRGRHAGTLGDAGCFSFQASKNITCGEGGIILTNDAGIAETARSVSNCGRTKNGLWYAHYNYGGNHRMTEFQAAILHAQLDRYPALHEQREEAARFLFNEIQDLEGYINLAPLGQGSRSSWHIFAFRLDSEPWGDISKERIVEAIRAEGIPISPGYSLPVHKQPLFVERNFGPKGGPTVCFEQDLPDFREFCLPNAEKACFKEALWLTQNILLADKEMMSLIVEALRKVFKCRDQLIEK